MERARFPDDPAQQPTRGGADSSHPGKEIMSRRRAARLIATCFGGLLGSGISGCHSAFVETTIDNQGETPVRLVEVDYPNASFGTGSIGSHSQFHYRFKIQGSGTLKIEFTDTAGRVRDSDGPELKQGQEGHLTIVIQPTGEVGWQPQLTSSE